MLRFLTALLLLTQAATLNAASRWISGLQSTAFGPLASSAKDANLYLADRGTSEIVVIDGVGERVLRRVKVGGYVWDLALDPSGTRLAVGLDGAVGVLDTQTFAYREVRLPAGVQGAAISVAYHSSGALFVAVNKSPRGFSPVSTVYGLSPDLTRVVSLFLDPGSARSFYFPLLRTDARGQVLYVLERFLSLCALSVMDVRLAEGPRPLQSVNVLQTEFRDVVDFTPAIDQPRLFVAGSYSGVQTVPTAPVGRGVIWRTGSFPAGLAESKKRGTVLSGLSTPNDDRLFELDSLSGALVATYDLLDEVPFSNTSPQGVAISRSPSKAFVVHGMERTVGTSLERVQVIDLVPRGR